MPVLKSPSTTPGLNPFSSQCPPVMPMACPAYCMRGPETKPSFTALRSAMSSKFGAPNFDDMALRKAANEGFVSGPRMQYAGHAIGITGGHCDENGFKPGVVDGDFKTGIADGVDQVRAAVRYQ